MKLTNGELYALREPFQEILKVTLPVLVSYKLAKLNIKITEELKVLDQTRDGLVKKNRTEGQTDLKSTDAGWAPFVTEMNELLTVEVELELPGNTKIKIPAKVGEKDVEIAGGVLAALDKIVEVVE